MRSLSLLILSGFVLFFNQKVKSPHGDDFKIACNTCHSAKGWQLDKEIYTFNHSATRLPLTGQHTELNCRQCHTSLVFKTAKSECVDCHKDIHQSTVGADCSRCHTPASWLVSNVTEIHQKSRFPLSGAHRTADCIQCHKSESNVRFDVPGVKCIDCHRQNYTATSNPNHLQSGFSENCSACHPANSFQWAGAGFNHNFFPLQLGHSSLQCVKCHTTPVYTDAKPECYSCHATNYQATKNPGHNVLKFSTNCQDCHTLVSGWKPAAYTQHDTQFPIYSGRHKGTWSYCTDCHQNAANYIAFTCFQCHPKSNMDNTHRGVNGYASDGPSCFRCHPKGSGGG
jgi:hypothetical protein